MKNHIKTLLTLLVFLLVFFSRAYAENEITEGYDENTEVTLKGPLKEITRGMRGPVILIIHAGNKDYKIVTAPPWYIQRQAIQLTPGKSYEVTGSKYISADGNIYIIASRLKELSTGRVIQLRDEMYMPLWHGHGKGRGWK